MTVSQLREVYQLPILPPDDQFFCPHCIINPPLADSISSHKTHSWARTLLCPKCQRKWHVCTECNTKKALTDYTAIKNHKYRTATHQNVVDVPDDTNFSSGGGDGQLLDDDDEHCFLSIPNDGEAISTPPSPYNQYCQHLPSGSFGRAQCQDYFEYNARFGNITSQAGFDWIIAKSQTRLELPPFTQMRSIDRLVYDDLIHLCTKLSRNDRNVLGRLLGNFQMPKRA